MRTAALVLVGLLVGGAAVYAFAHDREPDERQRALQARIDSLSSEVSEARRALAVKDSTAAVEIREAQETRARTDTVWQASTDTLMAALPDTLRPALERMVRADSVEDAAYEAEIAALHDRIAARDSVIDRLDAKLAAQEALTAHLKDRLDPPLLERVFGGLGEGALRAGVVGVAVLADQPEAAAGAGVMWAVDAAF